MSQSGNVEALEGLFALPAHEPVEHVGGLWFVRPGDSQMYYETALLGRHMPITLDPVDLINIIRTNLERELDCTIPARRIVAAVVMGFPAGGTPGGGNSVPMERLASLVVVSDPTTAVLTPGEGRLRRVGGTSLGYEMSSCLVPDQTGRERQFLAIHLPVAPSETGESIVMDIAQAAPRMAGGPVYVALHHHLPTHDWLERLVQAPDL